MNNGEAREMARGLVRGSIIEDAASQFIALVLKETHDSRIKPLRAEVEALAAKLALVIAAYRIEAMRRDDYSHDAFDQHIAELKGQIDHDLARASRCRHQPDLPIRLGHPLARKP